MPILRALKPRLVAAFLKGDFTARTGSLVIPANLSDVGSLISAAMTVIKTQHAAPASGAPGGPPPLP